MRRFRPTPATCIALLALFISLGGTTYAVTSLPRASVGTPQLRTPRRDRGQTGQRRGRDPQARQRRRPRGEDRARVDRRLADRAGRARRRSGRRGGARRGPQGAEADRAALATRATVADRVEQIESCPAAPTGRTWPTARRTRTTPSGRTARRSPTRFGVVDTNVQERRDPGPGLRPSRVECDSGHGSCGRRRAMSDPRPGWPAQILSNGPVTGGWEVFVVNSDSSDPATVRASVICIRGGRT